MNRYLIIAWVLVAMTLPACAAEQTPEEEVVSAALNAINACYHWAEEVGDADAERARAIDEGFSRDCPEAQTTAKQAHTLYPGNQALAPGLLKLNDIGYFQLAENERKALCQKYATLAKQEFVDSQRKDQYFSEFCPAQASLVYEG